MLFEIKEIDYCRLNIKFEADPEQVESKREEIVQHFKNSQVPGFRTGKATNEAIKHFFKNKINDIMKTELAQNAFHTVIAEKNIKPFGQPKFLSVDLNGSKFKCDFALNKLPDIELNQYKGFDIPKGQIPNAVEMAERILQELRTVNGETLPFTDEDFIQNGDTVIVNFEAFPEGQDSPIKKDGDMFVVGKSNIGPFNDNLLGMKIGEKREFTIHMPNNNDEFSGKQVKFIVEMVMGSKSIPCALDDALAHKIGAKDLQDMINITQSMASKRVQEFQQKHFSEQIASRIIESHTFEIPSWLAFFEAQLLAKQYGSNWENLSDEHKDNFIKFATKNVKLSIILDKIREMEPEAQLSDEEVIKIMKTNISSYKNKLPGMQDKSDEEIFQTIIKSGYISSFALTIRDDYALDFILKNSNIVE